MWARVKGALVYPTYAEFVATKRHADGSVTGRFRAKGAPDYVGQIGARHLACEVKRENYVKAKDGSRLYARLNHSTLPEHQRNHLYECGKRGGLALLAVVFPEGLAVWRFPVPGWTSGTSLTFDNPHKLASDVDLTLLP